MGTVEVDPKLLNVISKSVEAGVNDGVKRAIKEIEREKNKKLNEKYDKKIRNTKLLLKNYRKFKRHIKETTYTEEQLETATVSEILDKLYILEDDERDDLTIVQAILKSKKRTEIIIQHVDTIIIGYTDNSRKSKDNELKRRVNVINKLFIEGKKAKSYEEIAVEEHASISTIKRDEKRGIKELAILMFGVDGIRFD